MNEVEETDQPIEIKKAPTAAPPEKIVNIAPPRKPEGGNGGEMAATSSAGPEKTVPTFVYALGRVVPRFPSPGVEKEFARAAGVTETTGLTDQETFHAVLSKREN